MDRIDGQLIALLARDGRLSWRELAEAVHLSPNAVADRVRRLREGGVIRHIRAVVDPAALGRTLEAQIEVKLDAATAALDFENALRHVPQILSAVLMTGSFDYAIRVACTSREELMQVTEQLRRHAGVRETYTRMVLREVQFPAAV